MNFTDWANIMNISKTFNILAATLMLIAGTGSAWFAYAGDAASRVSEITYFQSERIKCYCTEDGKDGLRLQGKNLNKYFRATGNTVDIYHCGNSNRVLIFLHEDAIGDDSTCYASAEQVSENFYHCWIKESYIEQGPACEAAQANNLDLAVQQAQCAQLGAVLGAGACKKEDKD